MESFFKWLFSEAGAGWVFGTVSFIALILSHIRKTIPPRIVIEEMSSFSLVHVRKNIASEIKVSFRRKQVKELGRLVLELYNEGNVAITDPNITIQLPQHSKFLETICVSSTGDIGIQTKINGETCSVVVPYINPYKDHNHALQISSIIDGKIEGYKIGGSGKGWSIRHVLKPSPKQMEWKAYKRLLIYIVVIIAPLYIYSEFIQAILGISSNELTLRSFWAYLPFFVFLAIATLVLFKSTFFSKRRNRFR